MSLICLTYLPLCQSSVTVQSLSENATTPVSLPSSVLNQTPPRPRSDKPGLRVAAQMESYGGSYGTLGSMIGGLQGGDESPLPSERRSSGGHKPDLLPGSNHHMWPDAAAQPAQELSLTDLWRLVCSRWFNSCWIMWSLVMSSYRLQKTEINPEIGLKETN